MQSIKHLQTDWTEAMGRYYWSRSQSNTFTACGLSISNASFFSYIFSIRIAYVQSECMYDKHATCESTSTFKQVRWFSWKKVRYFLSEFLNLPNPSGRTRP
jgi:hypothetical protein